MMAKSNKDRQNLQHFMLENNLRTVATDKKKIGMRPAHTDSQLIGTMEPQQTADWFIQAF